MGTKIEALWAALGFSWGLCCFLTADKSRQDHSSQWLKTGVLSSVFNCHVYFLLNCFWSIHNAWHGMCQNILRLNNTEPAHYTLHLILLFFPHIWLTFCNPISILNLAEQMNQLWSLPDQSSVFNVEQMIRVFRRDSINRFLLSVPQQGCSNTSLRSLQRWGWHLIVKGQGRQPGDKGDRFAYK